MFIAQVEEGFCFSIKKYFCPVQLSCTEVRRRLQNLDYALRHSGLVAIAPNKRRPKAAPA